MPDSLPDSIASRHSDRVGELGELPVSCPLFGVTPHLSDRAQGFCLHDSYYSTSYFVVGTTMDRSHAAAQWG